MNYETIIQSHWHVPTAAIAFMKYLLTNRDIKVENNLDAWKFEIVKIQRLTLQEETLLEVIIKRIEAKETTYTIEVFFALIKDTAIRYLNDTYVLMKYLKNVTYDDSWNAWYRQTRGCVIDINEVKLVSATMEKFFNVDEKLYTANKEVLRRTKKGKVTTYIKQDGSCITMSYQDELLITTPGSFESQQVLWATDYLTNYHTSFLQDVHQKMNHYTFIFEYVGPKNRVVVLYKKTDMVLLQIIDTRTGRLLSLNEVKEIADIYGFTMCQTTDEPFDVLMVEKDNVEKYKADSIEGWIIRIDTEEETFMVKLKCGDYLSMHHMISNVTHPNWVYESMLNETLDDNIGMVENEEVKAIVLQIRQKIKEWEIGIKEKAQKMYRSVPYDYWIEDELIQLNRLFKQQVEVAVQHHPKADKIQKFLELFSKGKMENEMEEVRLKASNLFREDLLDLEKLGEYDAYKTFVSNRIKELMQDIEEAFYTYVQKGLVHETYGEWFRETYPQFYFITNRVEKAEEWDTYFKENKEEFYRLAQVSKQNLTSDYYDIHDYAKKKYAVMEELKVFIPKLRKQATDYVWRETTGVESIIRKAVSPEWIIEGELHTFYEAKKHFEDEVVANYYPNEKQSVINQIVKEFYLFARGQKQDDSYEVAQSIYASIDESIKQQSLYYQKKGKFSGYVNQHIPSEYRSLLFELLDLKTFEREQMLREKQFLSEATIITDEKKERIKAFEIDFRQMNTLTNTMSLDE